MAHESSTASENEPAIAASHALENPTLVGLDVDTRPFDRASAVVNDREYRSIALCLFWDKR